MTAKNATETTAKTAYHHGNLRAALLDAGLELAREGGPDTVVLREASRRVGVSHNAAYRHFPDREALLAEVGLLCMRRLARLMEELIAEVDPDDDSVEAARLRLRATGTAYVRFALGEPGLFKTAFCLAGTPIEGADPHAANLAADLASADERPGPFELLQQQLDRLLAAGGLAPERRPYADYAAWAAVHGFSMLMLEPLKEFPDEQRDAALDRLLDTIERGLAPGSG
ncbi:MAG: TetR/AcrR family transcriptional regulator [Solirubrobacteraceae bacterium]